MQKILNIKAIGLDLDGVVYFGNRPFPGAVKAINRLRRMGLQIFFISNNSVKTRQAIAKKLLTMGIKTAVDEIFTSGYAAAIFLYAFHRPSKKRILVIGSDGLKNEFRQLGLTVIDEPLCDFLVVGYDPDFTYKKISLGLNALLKGGKFVACNRVANFPIENGKILPGCGAMVAAIEAASGRKPDFFIGKPNTFMLKLAAQKLGYKAKEIVIMGDSVEEDILMANQFGSFSILISKDCSIALKGLAKPTLVVKSLGDIEKIVKNEKEERLSA